MGGDRESCRCSDGDRVAIRCRFRRAHQSDHTGCAGNIFDDHGLTQLCAQRIGTTEHVSAARPEGNDQPDWFDGISLGPGIAEQNAQRSQYQQHGSCGPCRANALASAAVAHHVPFPVCGCNQEASAQERRSRRGSGSEHRPIRRFRASRRPKVFSQTSASL